MLAEMLTVKNSGWLEDGESEMSESILKNALALYVVQTGTDGSVELYYRAGNVFLGHEILVSVDASGQYVDATLVG